jgi:hypothetical protein
MIIDIKTKAAANVDVAENLPTEEEKQAKLVQEQIVKNLKNMVRLAEDGYIVSFFCTGFSMNGKMFVNGNTGTTTPHEMHSAIQLLASIYTNVVNDSEIKYAMELGMQKNAFGLPQLTEQENKD